MDNKSKFRKFIDGYMWMFGVMEKDAIIAYKFRSDKFKNTIIEAWELHCKQAIDD